MLMLLVPDAAQVERWLQQASIHHYICDQCHGLHLSELQGRDGVLDSRIFVEEDGLLLTTEVEIRPASLLMMLSEIARLNMTWPTLKIFIDLNDDALPRLVACDLLLARAGVSFEQFVQFAQANIDATAQLLEECQQLDCLFDPEDELPPERDALH